MTAQPFSVFSGEELSYKAFQSGVDRMAESLIAKGVKQGDIVGIMCDRSIDLMVGIFGILKSGSAYLPIDPSYPEARIAYILKDSGVKLLMCPVELGGDVTSTTELFDLRSMDELTEGETFESRATADGLAYVGNGPRGRPSLAPLRPP